MENFGSWSVLTTNFLIVLYLALNGVTLASVRALWGFLALCLMLMRRSLRRAGSTST